MGDYIARIYEEAKQRPLYVANRIVNLSEPADSSRITVVHSGAVLEERVPR